LLEAGLKSLPGLVDMSPRCTFLQDLANVDPARYWGIQAQYRAEGRLIAALANKGMDIIFRNKANGLIVPTDGVSQTSSLQNRHRLTFLHTSQSRNESLQLFLPAANLGKHSWFLK
jgi:hypothetical protein